MKHYFLKLFLFTLPIFIYFAVPFFVSLKAGELTSFEEIVQKSSSVTSSLFGLAYTEFERPYKLAVLKEKTPEILALGSSRVLAFKSSSFKPDTTFYNAGRAIDYAEDFLSVLQKIPATSSPKLILLGLDPRFFDPREVANIPLRRTSYPIEITERAREIIRNQTYSIWTDIFSGKIDFTKLFENSTSTIGLNARLHSKGFLSDGSYNYPSTHPPLLDTPILATESGAWEFGTHVSEEALASLEAFLREAKARNIQVVGFMPPYSERMRVEIEQSQSPAALTILKEPKILAELFKKYKFRFLDASWPKIFGSSDEELIDSIHGSPEMYEKLLKQLAKRDSVLKKYLIY